MSIEPLISSALSSFIRGTGALRGMSGPIPTSPSIHGGGRVTAFFPGACAPVPGTTIGGASGLLDDVVAGSGVCGAPP